MSRSPLTSCCCLSVLPWLPAVVPARSGDRPSKKIDILGVLSITKSKPCGSLAMMREGNDDKFDKAKKPRGGIDVSVRL